MKRIIKSPFFFAPLIALNFGAYAEEVDFNRDIRPILSDRCFHCHGPDAKNQKSDFRIDTWENATEDLGGYAGIVPGHPELSELVARLDTDAPDEIMPPPDSNRSITEEEKELLRQWVAQGAEYDEHWSFKAPVKAPVPDGEKAIDYFVKGQLEKKGLPSSVRASKPQLIRRVSLDLTGLPPTPEEVADFLADDSPNAYEKVVNRLLDSPRYGERMAQVWLDAGRYADTAGYQNDGLRTQWPWRDWVIKAYNQNMPFDRFSIEQLAGDLLPDADESTRLATAFNRNHRINGEGGIVPQEYLTEYIADRVETTSTVWLGLTTACARCHDHKYDPISMRDFYSMYAFFNSIPEEGSTKSIAPVPNMVICVPGVEDEYEQKSSAVERLEAEQNQHIEKHQGGFEAWEAERRKSVRKEFTLPKALVHYSFDHYSGDTVPNLAHYKQGARIKGRRNYVRFGKEGQFGSGAEFANSGAGILNLGRFFGGNNYVTQEAISWSFFVKPGKKMSGSVLSSFDKDAGQKGYRISLTQTKEDEDGDLAVTFRLGEKGKDRKKLEVVTEPIVKRGTSDFTHISVTYDGSLSLEGVKIYVNGQLAPISRTKNTLEKHFQVGGEHFVAEGLVSSMLFDELYIYRKLLSAENVAALATSDSVTTILASGGKNPVQKKYVKSIYFENQDPTYKSLLVELGEKNAVLTEFEKKYITRVSIMEEMPEPRDTYLLARGAYDQPDKSEKILPQTLSELPPMSEGLPSNRLGLAKWIFQDDNPLTPRVAVNRYWQMLFGIGLVKTPEDFGSQGALPSHPKLLDWLAVDFRESGWDVKGMLRQIVTSETYCQDSRTNAERIEKDPKNEWMSRGPRFRLSAYTLRDQALAVSGLLVEKEGGAPVKPYQPAGLWEEVTASKKVRYAVDKGEGSYRRSLYTFWKRTVPPPSMMNFDTSGRDMCSVNMSQTNTPLQAMNLLNDPQYVEAARVLGERMMQEGGLTAEERVTRGTQLLWGRTPTSEELSILTAGYQDYLATFQKDPSAAKDFVSIGHSTPDSSLAVPELAACSAVASILFNLDETVTKE